MKTIKEKNITYWIVYASDFIAYAEDESYVYDTYKEAKSRLSNMDDKDELTIIQVSDDDIYCREGSRWEKLS